MSEHTAEQNQQQILQSISIKTDPNTPNQNEMKQESKGTLIKGQQKYQPFTDDLTAQKNKSVALFDVYDPQLHGSMGLKNKKDAEGYAAGFNSDPF